MSTSTTGIVPGWDMADRLRKSLRVSGVSVQEMADYLGVERNTVGRYINGRSDPDVRTLRVWAMATGVNVEWLANGKTPQPVEAGGSGRLPRLDLNQRPSDYPSCEVGRPRRSTGTGRGRVVQLHRRRQHGQVAA